jgi:wobble nucleotide-excising tRNase
VVGVAWFLALHLLQPAERRRVLVLDDPTSGFDTVNRGGFIATLRAFARLTRPEQLLPLSAAGPQPTAPLAREALADRAAGGRR